MTIIIHSADNSTAILFLNNILPLLCRWVERSKPHPLDVSVRVTHRLRCSLHPLHADLHHHVKGVDSLYVLVHHLGFYPHHRQVGDRCRQR
jgi:hypothetical protein